MIYEYPLVTDPIRQGDIFAGLPHVEVSLRRVSVLAEDESVTEMPWDDLADTGEPVSVVLPVRPVIAVVVSQDCDASRAPDLTLCEIADFRDVEQKSKDTNKPKSWMRIITQQCRQNQKWFYLPPDARMGFREKMGVQFCVTMRLPRQEMEGVLHLRKGRLNEVACAHFRERLAEFFRRYPYDEWYPLSSEELVEYQHDHPDAQPFPWQRIPPSV